MAKKIYSIASGAARNCTSKFAVAVRYWNIVRVFYCDIIAEDGVILYL